MTPAAISHQIRELEDQIGAPLFARTSRSMRLTREGEIRIAKRIEEGERRVLQVVLNSPIAVQEILKNGDSLRKGWMAARADALKKAGLDAIFE